MQGVGLTQISNDTLKCNVFNQRGVACRSQQQSQLMALGRQGASDVPTDKPAATRQEDAHDCLVNHAVAAACFGEYLQCPLELLVSVCRNV